MSTGVERALEAGTDVEASAPFPAAVMAIAALRLRAPDRHRKRGRRDAGLGQGAVETPTNSALTVIDGRSATRA